MTRSRSGQHHKVEDARRAVQQALGDAARHDRTPNAANYVPTKPPEHVEHEDVASMSDADEIGELNGRFARLVRTQMIVAPSLEPRIIQRLQTPQQGEA